MEPAQLIPADEFCTYYNIEVSFINDLEHAGLLQVATIEEKPFIPFHQLQQLERFIRIHYELQVNLEGIEVIDHLLGQVKHLQQEVAQLKNRLGIYEKAEQATAPDDWGHVL